MSVPRRGNSKCKGPEVGRNRVGWKHRKKQVWLELREEDGAG